MWRKLLAHIDTLDAALHNLTERIEFVLAPHAQMIELLSTSRVQPEQRGPDRRVRSRHERVPDGRALRFLGGACPGHHDPPVAGVKATRPGPAWLTSQLTECARAAVRTKGTYLAAHYAQLRGRRGEQKAIGAIRHDLLVAYFHIVRDHVPYRDLGPDWQRKRYSVEHRARRLQRQLEALGYAVTLDQTLQTEQAA